MGFKKTVQSMFGRQSQTSDDEGLRCVAGELPRTPPNVLPAAAVKPDKAAPPLPDCSPAADSLALCTENLGFENGCEASISLEDEEPIAARTWAPPPRKKPLERRPFPPPLTWLSGGADPSSSPSTSSFMKAVKKDGRLILTEIRIERTEFLRATRCDGRLSMKLVKKAPPPPPPAAAAAAGRCQLAATPFLVSPRCLTAA